MLIEVGHGLHVHQTLFRNFSSSQYSYNMQGFVLNDIALMCLTYVEQGWCMDVVVWHMPHQTRDMLPIPHLES